MATYKTEQKKELIKFLTDNKDKAFTIDEICRGMEACSNCTPPGRSTIYRLIPKLLEENIIRQFTREESLKTVYQIVGGEQCREHLHLKCTVCQNIFHMGADSSQTLLNLIKAWDGFEMNMSKTIIFGVCRNCKGDL
jgi:Fur family ferric uptake transcriptional regulator